MIQRICLTVLCLCTLISTKAFSNPKPTTDQALAQIEKKVQAAIVEVRGIEEIFLGKNKKPTRPMEISGLGVAIGPDLVLSARSLMLVSNFSVNYYLRMESTIPDHNYFGATRGVVDGQFDQYPVTAATSPDGFVIGLKTVLPRSQTTLPIKMLPANTPGKKYNLSVVTVQNTKNYRLQQVTAEAVQPVAGKALYLLTAKLAEGDTSVGSPVLDNEGYIRGVVIGLEDKEILIAPLTLAPTAPAQNKRSATVPEWIERCRHDSQCWSGIAQADGLAAYWSKQYWAAEIALSEAVRCSPDDGAIRKLLNVVIPLARSEKNAAKLADYY